MEIPDKGIAVVNIVFQNDNSHLVHNTCIEPLTPSPDGSGILTEFTE
ncbi:MAG: hypothetical protein RLZZ500_1199 [Bacteroidota bacterium]